MHHIFHNLPCTLKFTCIAAKVMLATEVTEPWLTLANKDLANILPVTLIEHSFKVIWSQMIAQNIIETLFTECFFFLRCLVEHLRIKNSYNDSLMISAAFTFFKSYFPHMDVF